MATRSQELAPKRRRGPVPPRPAATRRVGGDADHVHCRNVRRCRRRWDEDRAGPRAIPVGPGGGRASAGADREVRGRTLPTAHDRSGREATGTPRSRGDPRLLHFPNGIAAAASRGASPMNRVATSRARFYDGQESRHRFSATDARRSGCCSSANGQPTGRVIPVHGRPGSRSAARVYGPRLSTTFLLSGHPNPWPLRRSRGRSAQAARTTGSSPLGEPPDIVNLVRRRYGGATGRASPRRPTDTRKLAGKPAAERPAILGGVDLVGLVCRVDGLHVQRMPR